jgi:hypothetical protein
VGGWWRRRRAACLDVVDGEMGCDVDEYVICVSECVCVCVWEGGGGGVEQRACVYVVGYSDGWMDAWMDGYTHPHIHIYIYIYSFIHLNKRTQSEEEGGDEEDGAVAVHL